MDDRSVLAGMVRMARFAADALDSGWKNWVIGFSSSKQRRMLASLGLDYLRGPALALAIGISVLMLAWSLLLARPVARGDPVQRAWSRLSRKLGRVGLARQPHEGPVDYRDRVAGARPDLAGTVGLIVGLYLRCRYRPGPDKRDDAALLRRVNAFNPKRRR
jgi:hypothetical protein